MDRSGPKFSIIFTPEFDISDDISMTFDRPDLKVCPVYLESDIFLSVLSEVHFIFSDEILVATDIIVPRSTYDVLHNFANHYRSMTHLLAFIKYQITEG